MKNTELPSEYLLIRQPSKSCEVLFIKETEETVLFSGKRWDARRFLKDFRNQVAYESVRAFCRKKPRNGFVNFEEIVGDVL